jgi:hypothetical protein
METQNKLTRSEIIVVIFCSVILWLLLAQANGREAHSDVLWYMNMSQNHISDPHWFTRYTHVYLQTPFLAAFADPFVGIVWFWAFLIASAAGLIYFLHRLLFPSSTPIHASLSAGLFLAFDLHSANIGVPQADLTATLVMLVILFAFWLIMRRGSPSVPGLIFLGSLFFVAFKAKETIWVSGLLVIGALQDEDGKIFNENWLKRFKWIFIGLLAGLLEFAFLNAYFLHDFFFGLKPLHWKIYLSFWVAKPEYYPGAENWLVDGFMLVIPYVFLLYLTAGFKLPQQARKQKLIWALPFAAVLFLTFGMVKSTYVIDPRFLIPSQAIMAIFVPSLFPFSLPPGAKQRRSWFGKLIGGLVIYGVLFECLKVLVTHTGINFTNFVSSVFYPIVVSLILLIVLANPKQDWLKTLVPVILLVAFIRPGLLDNLREMELEPPENGFQTRFYPLYAFGDEITPTQEDSYFISTSIPEQELGFSDDLNTIRSIFDLYYGIRSETEQFSLVEPPMVLEEMEKTSGPVYLFLLHDELEAWQYQGDIPDNCQIFRIEGDELTLIKCTNDKWS